MERATRTIGIALAALLVAAAAGCVAHRSGGALERMDRFKVKRFVTGGWTIGNDYSDAYARRYAGAGLNIMIDAPTAMDVCRRHGIRVLITTMLHPVIEDGRFVPGRYNVGPYARVPDLKWFQEHFGRHPALAGYLLNDDSRLSADSVDCARWLKETAPEMIPYIAHNADAAAQARLADVLPILSSQNYPFGDHNDWPEEKKRQAYCDRLEEDRAAANADGMCLWPTLAALGRPEPGASQIRFQAYSAVAYGAQGLLYYSFSRHPVWSQKGVVFNAVRDCNQYINPVIGPRVLGCRSIGVYHSPGEADVPKDARRPGAAEFIEQMDASLLAGVLVAETNLKDGRQLPAYVMLVDKRTASDGAADPPARTVRVTFGAAVKTAEILGRLGAGGSVNGRTVSVELRAGDGVFLRITD